MKLKLLTLILGGITLCFSGLAANAVVETDQVKAEGTYVLAYSNPCANNGVQPNGGYNQFTKVFAVGDVSWRIQGYANRDDGSWVFGGGKTTTSGDRIFYTTTPIEDTITKIEMSTGAASGTATEISVNKVTLNVYASIDAEYVLGDLISTQEQAFTAESTLTFVNESGKDWTNAYYEFVYDLVLNVTSNKYQRITGFDFYKTVQGDSVVLDSDSIDLKTNGTATLTAAASGEVVWVAEPNDIISIETSGDLNEVATITGLKAGTTTITATVGTAVATCTVSVEDLENKFEKITDWANINMGDVVAFVFEDANVAITSVESSSMKSTSQLTDGVIDEYLPFQVTKGFDGQGYAFVTPDGKYLNNTSDTTLTLAGTLSLKSSWTIEFTDGVLKVTNLNTLRWLAWRNGYDYARAYNKEYDTTYKAPSIYRYCVSTEDEVNEAESFATLFLTSLRADGVCDVNGVNTDKGNLKEVWATYAEQYSALSEGAKAHIAKTKANAEGSDLEVLINTYEFITKRYAGETGLEDFMFRGVSASAGGYFFNSNSNSTMLIIVVASVMLIALAGCILYKKRKPIN